MAQRRRLAPRRPEHKVSIPFGDGVVRICGVSDTARPGYLPAEEDELIVSLPYDERKLGIQRYYAAAQNQTRVQRVIRVPKPPADITNREIAVTEDGKRYRIDLVQTVPDLWPESLDLTLAAFEQGVI